MTMLIDTLVPNRKRTDFYRVREQSDGTFTCTCPDYTYRESKVYGGACKHIIPIAEAARSKRVAEAHKAGTLGAISDLYA